MKLFILGNGFDLAHSIRSRYQDFGDFLSEYKPEFYNNLMSAFQSDHSIWGAFEDALPLCADYIENDGLNIANERLEELDYDPMRDEGIGHLLREQYNFIKALPTVLKQWVESIDTNVPPVFKKDVFLKDDLFLVFNYTDTLEKLYHVNPTRICHIHGYVKNSNDILIMGHGGAKYMEYVERELLRAQSEFADCAVSVYTCALEYLKSTYKRVDAIIQRHNRFIQKAELADEIHVIGCSLSTVEKPYFERLIGKGRCKWVFYYHNEVALDELKKKIADLSIDFSSYQFVPIKCIQ